VNPSTLLGATASLSDVQCTSATSADVRQTPDAVSEMPFFLLSRTDYHLSAHDPSESFTDRSVAAEAFRDGRVSTLTGALPFDPEAAAALTAPARLSRRAGPWRPPAVPTAPAIRSARQQPAPATHRERVRRAVELLATADLDLRGDTDLEPEMVMEILVARLSRLGAGRVSSRR